MPSDANTPPLPEPLAYFLTWTTYGTWLPGDERGWVRRPGNSNLPELVCGDMLVNSKRKRN